MVGRTGARQGSGLAGNSGQHCGRGEPHPASSRRRLALNPQPEVIRATMLEVRPYLLHGLWQRTAAGGAGSKSTSSS